MKICLMLSKSSLDTMIEKSWHLIEKEETVIGFRKLSRNIHGLENLKNR
jgi:hypothetical protein